jgi:hypothetical protein
MKLCSDVDKEITHVVCDKPLGHSGPHQATVTWGDEVEMDPYAVKSEYDRLILERRVESGTA